MVTAPESSALVSPPQEERPVRVQQQRSGGREQVVEDGHHLLVFAAVLLDGAALVAVEEGHVLLEDQEVQLRLRPEKLLGAEEALGGVLFAAHEPQSAAEEAGEAALFLLEFVREDRVLVQEEDAVGVPAVDREAAALQPEGADQGLGGVLGAGEVQLEDPAQPLLVAVGDHVGPLLLEAQQHFLRRVRAELLHRGVAHEVLFAALEMKLRA